MNKPGIKKIILAGRVFFAAAIFTYGVLQLIYRDFRNVLLPPWQSYLPLLPLWAYIFGFFLIGTAAAIIIGKKGRTASLALGGTLLFFFCFFHIPYELISEPHSSFHFGVWANSLKELALAGGAFILAGALPPDGERIDNRPLMNFLEKLIPYGPLFFSFTMTSFGISHFLYIDFMAKMVPAWIPDKLFWAYFGGAALIGCGCFIILDIRRQTIATLLGCMLLLWVFMVHLPGAIADPYLDRSNLVASTFDALAFSGTAFLIAFSPRNKDEMV